MTELSYETITNALNNAGQPDAACDLEVFIEATKAYVELLNACTVVNTLYNISDGAGQVRGELNLEDVKGWEGSTWRHPKVKQYSHAASTIAKHIATAAPPPKGRKAKQG